MKLPTQASCSHVDSDEENYMTLCRCPRDHVLGDDPSLSLCTLIFTDLQKPNRSTTMASVDSDLSVRPPKPELTGYSAATRAVHADDAFQKTPDVAPAMHVSTTFEYSRNPADLKPIADSDVSHGSPAGTKPSLTSSDVRRTQPPMHTSTRGSPLLIPHASRQLLHRFSTAAP